MLVFHPRDADARRCRRCSSRAGDDEVVTLSQLVAFLSFQIRVVARPQGPGRDAEAEVHDRQDHPAVRPCVAGRLHPRNVEWLPWLEPVAPTEMTNGQLASLVDAARVKSRLLPAAGARPGRARGAHPDRQGHLLQPRRRPAARRARARRRQRVAPERLHLLRLGACAVRRDLLQAHDDVDRLLAEGTGVDLDKRWNAIVAAAVALTETPISFGPEHIDRLREVGLDDDAIVDVINAASFFNWANRLMLSLGEPTPAKVLVLALGRATPVARLPCCKTA